MFTIMVRVIYTTLLLLLGAPTLTSYTTLGYLTQGSLGFVLALVQAASI